VALKALLFVVAIVIGAIWLLGQGSRPAQSATDSCLTDVDKLARAYAADRPQGGSHTQIENGITLARKFCQEGKFADAQRNLNTSGMICVLNNGCAKPR
jgi:hypothetical protein